MSNYDDDFDDEAVKRSNLLTRLEGHTGPMDADEDGYAPDELDQADHLLGALDTSGSSDNAGGLAGKVSLRAQAWSNLNTVAPFMRINPPSSLQGILGNQQTVMSGQKLTVANWAASADAETLPVTIVVAPVGALPRDTDIAYAIIQFGTHGMSVLVEVDISYGTQLTVGASAVSVQVCLPAPRQANVPEGISAGPMLSRVLAGMMSFYPANRTAQLTRTYNMTANQAGNTFLFFDNNGLANTFSVPPPFARRATVYFGDVHGTATYAITVLSDSGPLFPEYVEVIAANSTKSSTFDIPGNCTSIEVVATAGSATGVGYIVYELSV